MWLDLRWCILHVYACPNCMDVVESYGYVYVYACVCVCNMCISMWSLVYAQQLSVYYFGLFGSAIQLVVSIFRSEGSQQCEKRPNRRGNLQSSPCFFWIVTWILHFEAILIFFFFTNMVKPNVSRTPCTVISSRWSTHFMEIVWSCAGLRCDKVLGWTSRRRWSAVIGDRYRHPSDMRFHSEWKRMLRMHVLV
jgi:hypothetical protein